MRQIENAENLIELFYPVELLQHLAVEDDSTLRRDLLKT